MVEQVTVVKQKRGRKPKKDITVLNNIVGANEIEIVEENLNMDTNINAEPIISISSNVVFNVDEIETTSKPLIEDEIFETTDENLVVKQSTEKPLTKKRGRKPKGGKIIQQLTPVLNTKNAKPSIILHLKCSMKDLNQSTIINNHVESYHFSNKNDLSFEIISNENENNYSAINNQIEPESEANYYTEDDYSMNKETDTKELWKKIKQLEHNLHINNISDKKSACFWCTYEFDNPPIYIPKYYVKNSYHVYGCFCSPECAVAHLMDENIDSSTKFERYHFINHIYAKIYNYDKNIKPAPNPYYMLDKYYGNLTIQEYRSLFKNERLFLIVDKPLTRVLPELHEDNDDFILNNKIIPSNTYQIKKKLIKKPQNKSAILNEKFGMSAN
jgi:hypothetical protein